MARIVGEVTAACYLYGSTAGVLGEAMGGNNARAYVDQMLGKLGVGTDPLGQLVVQQILLAHHNIGRLHTKAAQAATAEEVNAYNAAAARLLGEFRRLVSDFRDSRNPVLPGPVTVVNQQNVAAGDPQIAYVDAQADRSDSEKSVIRNELGSNRTLTNDYGRPIFSESATSCSGETQPVKAERAHRGGAIEASRGSGPQPPLGTLDRSQNPGGQSEISQQCSAAEP